LIERYRNPRPRIEAGERLAPIVTAMMDVSDGLLIDASRMAAASACGIDIVLESVPLSDAFLAACGEARLDAATAGDDYELLFAAAPETAPAILALADELGLPFSRIGACVDGAGLALSEGGAPVPLPPRLGFEHGRGGTNG
jgi:thiamine-monophosphate kinase